MVYIRSSKKWSWTRKINICVAICETPVYIGLYGIVGVKKWNTAIVLQCISQA